MQRYEIIIYLLMKLFVPISKTEKYQYISTEHPAVTYYNPNYISYGNMTSQRYGRHDPFYYVGIHTTILQAWDNNVTFDFYFYELLTNVYKPSFVEMHFKFCDLIHKDKFFGSAMKQGKLLQACPIPPGNYNLYNMTIPVTHIPPHFPFRKGRIYCNITAVDANALIANAHIDMEIKEYNTKRIKKKNKILSIFL